MGRVAIRDTEVGAVVAGAGGGTSAALTLILGIFLRFCRLWFMVQAIACSSRSLALRIDEIVVQDSRRQTRSLVLFPLVQKIPNCLNKNLG